MLGKLNNSRIFKIVIIVLTLFAFCAGFLKIMSSKTFLFYDEMVTFYRAVELIDDTNQINWEDPTDIINTTVTGADFSNTMILTQDKWLIGNKSVGYIIKSLLTERQHTILLNLLLGFCQGEFGLKVAIYFNLFLCVLCLLVVYFICIELFGDWKYGLLGLTLCETSVGVTLVAGYIRFYIFFALCMLILTLLYIRLAKTTKGFLGQLGYLIAILITTWFGYCNSEYALIYSGLLCFMYLLSSLMALDKKKFWYCFLIHIVAAVCFLIKNGGYLYSEYINGSENGIAMSQVRVAIDNLLGRTSQLFKVYWNTFFNDGVFYSVNKFVWIALIAFIVISIIFKQKWQDFFYFKGIYIVTPPIIIFWLIVSKIAPWDSWRYISHTYFLVPIFFVAIFQLFDFGKTKKILAAILIVAISFGTYAVDVSGTVKLELDNDGPTVANRKYMQENYAGVDSVYFYNNDAGTLFYGAFLWPDDGKVYFTTATDFRENTAEKTEIMKDDQLLVWIDRNDETLQKRVMFLMDVNGYTTKELVMDTGSEGRHLIYLFER